MNNFRKLIVLFCILLLASCDFENFSIIPVKRYAIPQNGMYPNLPAKSTLWAIRKPFFKVKNVSRGDIIIFFRKENGNTYDFIWRVIGLPGDHIEINGTSIYVNRVLLAQEIKKETSEKIIFLEKSDNAEYLVAYDKQPDISHRINVNTVVPDEHFFLLGDNRDNAWDSRFKGPVPFDNVIGKKL